MERMKSLIAIVAAIAFVTLAVAQLSAPQVVGDWEGESKCVNLTAAPDCKDEHLTFHITQVINKQGKPVNNSVLVRAAKILDKKPTVMGFLTFKLNSAMFTLQNLFKKGGKGGVWDLTVNRDKMTGTLTKMPEKIVIRKITMKRIKGK